VSHPSLVDVTRSWLEIARPEWDEAQLNNAATAATEFMREYQRDKSGPLSKEDAHVMLAGLDIAIKHVRQVTLPAVDGVSGSSAEVVAPTHAVSDS
jgi:hypothetical protein